MAQMPMPSPPLDGVPPSPPGLSAGGGPNPQISQLTPSMEFTGTLQLVQLALEAAGQAAKLIDTLGQAVPSFAPTAQLIIEQLKGGLKVALQQGSSGLEPSSAPVMPQGITPQPMTGAFPSAQQTMGEPQQPLPPMGNGF